MLMKTMLNFRKLFRKNYFIEINVISFPSKEWPILHPTFYIDNEYEDHGQKIFTNFEHTVSSDRARFPLLIQ